MKSIPEYPDYALTEAGELWSYKSKRFLKIHTNNKGYKYVTLCVNSKNINILLNRLLAYLYLDLPALTSELEVDHKDKDLNNNSLSNLQVLTHEKHLEKTLEERYTLPVKNCSVCGIKLDNRNQSNLCDIHYRESKNPAAYADGVTAKAIEYWVTNFSWRKASSELGLSDNGLRKRYKNLTGNPASTLKSARKT